MGGFSTVAGAGGATAAEIWSYSTRTLTQSKFPFWSAIITQNAGSISVASGATGEIVIQPSVGETWLVWINMGIAVDGVQTGRVVYVDYNGITERQHLYVFMYNASNTILPSITKVLTNSLYGKIKYFNNTPGTNTFVYGYSGFKLSKPHWTAEKPAGKPWRVKSSIALPYELQGLEKYLWDIYDAVHDRYIPHIILEEDTVLARDPDTGFPVERFTAYVDVNTLRDLVKRFKSGSLTPDSTGYRKYLEKWANEGIKLL